MGPVIADLSVSVDGFVADRGDQVGAVFSWYGTPQPEESAEQAQRGAREAGTELGVATGLAHELGAILYGRRTFDLANGWGGNHPLGVPVVVVAHEVPEGWPRPGSTVSFCTDGVDAALRVAVAIAGEDRIIAVGSPSIVAQLLDRGLLDGIRMSVVPVLLGEGVRYFDVLARAPIALDGPLVREGNGVTHLSYLAVTRPEHGAAAAARRRPPRAARRGVVFDSWQWGAGTSPRVSPDGLLAPRCGALAPGAERGRRHGARAGCRREQ